MALQANVIDTLGPSVLLFRAGSPLIVALYSQFWRAGGTDKDFLAPG